ncbi:hypothetical protein NQ318_012902 [Aromia moschata]|uniref:Uncharacterized protein n=1 Tax=Aromia moschata TaxID=1265417 RepID=A0AAV8YEG4_9CUCU|nr:hypothetical protein NQ318_012902 [Aromia moschata]
MAKNKMATIPILKISIPGHVSPNRLEPVNGACPFHVPLAVLSGLFTVLCGSMLHLFVCEFEKKCSAA